MKNPEDATCSASDLANYFDMTSRNVLHLVDRGMPVYKRGKAGREHVFKFPWVLHWYGGWYACQKWKKDLPGSLETYLIGYGMTCSYPTFPFRTWMKYAQRAANDMGYTNAVFDKAMQHVISKGLLRLE